MFYKRRKCCDLYFPGVMEFGFVKMYTFCTMEDTKVVCVASTVHSGHSCNQVKRRTKSSSGVQEQMIPIPRAIFDNNKKMGGVDLSDQLLQYYQTRRQSHKYWKMLLYPCIDIV